MAGDATTRAIVERGCTEGQGVWSRVFATGRPDATYRGLRGGLDILAASASRSATSLAVVAFEATSARA